MDTTGKQSLRVVRVMQVSFVIAGLLFILTTVRIPSRVGSPPPPGIEIAISIAALLCVAAGFMVPKFLSLAALQNQRSGPASPVQKWFTRCILSLAFFDACNVFAVALHFLGAHARVVELLFAVGMLTLIFWKPGTPPSLDQGSVTT
ncbi:MAG TPA: hypothetical protein VKR52_07340 [Terracidiphilus sp.]|nr:hypothetical protein [Terracidiphilus sp.]